jgi:hypothetical protein
MVVRRRPENADDDETAAEKRGQEKPDGIRETESYEDGRRDQQHPEFELVHGLDSAENGVYISAQSSVG